MANILFGLNIAQLVLDGVNAAGGLLTGTLTKRTATARTPGDLTSGLNPTSAGHSFQGFIENRTESTRAGSLVSEGGQFVSILGASLPSGIIPEQGDLITIEGTTFEVLSITERDPAAALYECLVGAS